VTWWADPDIAIEQTIREVLWSLIGPVHYVEEKGMLGYEKGCRFYVDVQGTSIPIARCDWGGMFHGGRARLDLSGTCCGLVEDWSEFAAWCEQQPKYKLTRVDLAVDCLDGEFTVEDARDWYVGGEFNAGGRNPRHELRGDWLDPKYGRTLTVGRRENGKMLRCYEKGRQLGEAASKWTRFEVELRNIDRDIPLDVILDPDTYFAGAYRCLQRLLDVAATRIATDKANGDISLGRLVEFARIAYGQVVTVLRGRLTMGQVLDEISRPGIPKRLHKASLSWWQPSHEAPVQEKRS
jgi:phage replication initiation protein